MSKEEVVKVHGTFLKGRNYCQCGFQLMGRPDFQPNYCHQCGRRLNWYEVTDIEAAEEDFKQIWEDERNIPVFKAEIERLKDKCNKQAKWITDNIDKAKRCSLTQHDQAIVIHGLRQSNADLRKNVQALKSDRDAWKRTCELIAKYLDKNSIICVDAESQVEHFYQQAKEGK